MPIRRKPAIARAFAGAEDYDAHAHIQRAAAHRLAELIAALGLPTETHALEIGCGTGFLSRRLIECLPRGRLILSDISESMVGRTRARLGEGGDIRYLVMDGERPALRRGGHLGLICSSLAFQWFEDLGGSVSRLIDLLAPGGYLVFATLASGSLAEWRTAHVRTGFEPATRDYPTSAELAGLCPPGAEVSIGMQTLVERHSDGMSFLRGLRAIGAHTPWEPRTPLSPGSMRRVLGAFEETGASATYQIAHMILRKLPEGL
jgi:malonyl-CoA O-methyltransferase